MEGAWPAHTGNGYYGGLQFDPRTYAHAGGRADGRADRDTPRQQLWIAWRLTHADGRRVGLPWSWREWGHRTRVLCGLR